MTATALAALTAGGALPGGGGCGFGNCSERGSAESSLRSREDPHVDSAHLDVTSNPGRDLFAGRIVQG
jgi:hypothetical protein